MIITVTPGLLTWPLLLMVWALDAYLFAVLLRAVLTRVPACRHDALSSSLQNLVDVVPEWVALQFHMTKSGGPAWLPWIVVVGGALIIRQLLFGLCMALR